MTTTWPQRDAKGHYLPSNLGPADWEYDELALSIVCVERIPMRLTGPDRVEAIRRLAAKGLLPKQIAPLLRISHHAISQIQFRHGIPPAPLPQPAWWANYTDSRYRQK